MAMSHNNDRRYSCIGRSIKRTGPEESTDDTVYVVFVAFLALRHAVGYDHVVRELG